MSNGPSRYDVFVDGAADLCPDCGGKLQYQNAVSLVCLECKTDFEHWKKPERHELVTVPLTGEAADIEVVATAPRDGADREVSSRE